MLHRRWSGCLSGFLVCSFLGLPARAGIIEAFDTARVLAYNQVGGEHPRQANFVWYSYDSTTGSPAGPFIAGDGAVDLLSFALPKFDKAGLAASLGLDISHIRLEEVIIDMGAGTLGGYNVIDNESSQAGTVYNLTIGAQVSVWSTNVAQQVTLSALPAKNLAANGPLTLGADDPNENGVPTSLPLFGQILNADYVGSDSLRVEITDMVQAASEVTLQADPSRPDGDDILSDFIGPGTIEWKATGTKVASDQSNVARQTENESPTFNVETRVVYIYSVAPEPTTLAALGLGFFPLLAKWRKRRGLGRRGDGHPRGPESR